MAGAPARHEKALWKIEYPWPCEVEAFSLLL
jgi:hypothetical protein